MFHGYMKMGSAGATLFKNWGNGDWVIYTPSRFWLVGFGHIL